jgi:hypothetical protein
LSGIHKSERDIYIGFSPAALHLQCMMIVFADLTLITYDAGKKLAAVKRGAHRQHCVVLHVHHRRRAKDKDSHWRARSNWIQCQDKMFIGSRQRARSNQIQSQHSAILFRQGG